MDREKVISGLQRCRLVNKVNCDKCPYDYNGRGNGKSECTAELAEDILAMLKEQEGIISALKSDVKETLEVVSGQLNVVHCKDCKHWQRRESGGYGTCESENMNICGFTDADWFCADAWKRDSYDGTWQAT